MYGRYQRLLYRNPLKRLVYGLLGGPRISDWMRFWSVRNALEHVTLPQTARILDAGCGRGCYSMMFAEHFPDAAITAADDDGSLIAGLRRATSNPAFENIDPVKADLAVFAPGQRYDLICCVDVLEHIPDDRTIFKQFACWLKPGGYLVLHVPQTGQRFEFVRRTHGRCGDPHVREGYEPEQLKALAASAGMKMVIAKETFGRLASLAVELDELLWQGRLYPVWFMAYPLMLAVAAGDCRRRVQHGQGILLVVRNHG